MNTPTPRVLLIEDNPEDITLLQHYLNEEEKRFEIVCCVRLSAGLESLAANSFDLILLDLGLPDSQGLAGLARIRAQHPFVPVVILTGMDDETLGLEAVRQGAQDYLVKGQLSGPFLTRTLRYAIERARNAEQLRHRDVQLQLLTNQLPASMWTTDDQYRITSSFGASLLGLNLPPSALVNRTLMECFPQTGAVSVIAAHHRALGGESVTFDFDGLGPHFHGHLEPICGGGNRILGTIGVALDITSHKRVEQGFRTAQKIQQGLLPQSAPSLGHFDIGGVSYSAEATGGDFFDYLPLPDGSLGIIIADVSGHGFGPAILAAVTHTCLRVLTRTNVDMSAILAATNRVLFDDTAGEQFVTLLFARLDPLQRSLVYASAGHGDGFVLDASGAIKTRVGSTALPLGVLSESEFLEGSLVRLDEGDQVIFLTDGIQDALSPDGSFFGIERALDVVRRLRHRSAQEIVESLCQVARAHYQDEPLRDDITAVIIKTLPVPAGSSIP